MEASRSDRLLVWGLAAFHTSLFGLILVILVLLFGDLGQALASLNTLAGLSIFGALWLTNWWCTRRVMREVDWTPAHRPVLEGRLLSSGMFWGGTNGVLFLLSLPLIALAGFGIEAINEGRLTDLGNLIFFAAIAAILGTVFAFPIGAVVGLIFAVIDSLLLRISVAVAAVGAIESSEPNH